MISPPVVHEFPSPPRMKIERLFSGEYLFWRGLAPAARLESAAGAYTNAPPPAWFRLSVDRAGVCGRGG
jgi:hypothetical protein